MQRLSPPSRVRGRLLFFVPRWLPPGAADAGLPYRVIPVLSDLLARGYEVRFMTEVQDGIDPTLLARALHRADAAVVWCAELNPGVQVGGILGTCEQVRAIAPSVHRVVGGGFFSLVPPEGLDPADRFGLGGRADHVVADDRTSALGDHLDEHLGAGPARPAGGRGRYDAGAMRQLDLTPFFGPASMIFDNNEPALQIPTGYGCAKHCPFCFYEHTRPELLAPDGMVDLITHVVRSYGVRQFLFGELDFFTGPARVERVVRSFLDRGLDVSWFALASVQDVLRMDRAVLDAVARSGCRALEIGSECGSREALRLLGKPFTPDDCVRATRRLLARGITPINNIVLGYVGETSRHRRATVRLVRRLARLDRRVRFSFRLYQAIPNTTMGREAFKRLPPLPTSLGALAAYRQGGGNGRNRPWLAPAEERCVEFLTGYLLPLVYGDALVDGDASLVRRLLRGVARARLEVGWYRWPLDRALLRRFESVPLPETYLP